jgi:hypothetical protein
MPQSEFKLLKMRSLAIIYLFCISFGLLAQKKNVSQEWIQLFNGKDLKNWRIKIRGYPLGENFANTFSVKDGKMKVSYDRYGNYDEKFGHIFYKNKFSYYLLAVEYRFIGEQVKGGPGWALRNSGAMIHSQSPESMGLRQDFPISIEVQLLGGDGKSERHTANLCTPGTNVVYKGKLFTDHCVDSDSKTFPGEQWVRVEALVLGDSVIKHIVNGDTVLVYEKPQIGGGNVLDYDPSEKADGKLLDSGYIALQSESHPIEFRKVELFDLSNYAGDKKKLKRILNELRKR